MGGWGWRPALQVAFLARYSASFEQTEQLDGALGAWEAAAELITLRELTTERLGLLEVRGGGLFSRVHFF